MVRRFEKVFFETRLGDMAFGVAFGRCRPSDFSHSIACLYCDIPPPIENRIPSAFKDHEYTYRICYEQECPPRLHRLNLGAQFVVDVPTCQAINHSFVYIHIKKS
jgi:hypothetical protein